jgi:solute carrier family 25 protein 44
MPEPYELRQNPQPNGQGSKVTVTPPVQQHGISDIKWDMLDKKRYIPLTVVNMLAVRTLLYPLTVVRTRLQVQTRGSLYTGTFNALHTIAKLEGSLALFKGFWVNSFQLFPHVVYITVYEVSALNNSPLKK